jgi:hypothetical protein
MTLQERTEKFAFYLNSLNFITMLGKADSLRRDASLEERLKTKLVKLIEESVSEN